MKEHVAMLAEKSGDFNSIILLRKEEFVDHPCLDNYEKLIRGIHQGGNKGVGIELFEDRHSQRTGRSKSR